MTVIALLGDGFFPLSVVLLAQLPLGGLQVSRVIPAAFQPVANWILFKLDQTLRVCLVCCRTLGW